MNISFWIKALRVIPRIEKDEWEKLDFISKWLVLNSKFYYWNSCIFR